MIGAWRWHVHSAYLPLASQTQFVESAAKEAKNVSAADQSEQLRTCMAIIQSATPLTTQGVKEANKNKMLSIIESAQERTEIHKHFNVTQHDRKHNQRFNNLLFTLSKQEHFKNEQNDVSRVIQSISGGAGYRSEKFYVDFAVVHRYGDNSYRPYSVNSPTSPLVTYRQSNTNLLVTLGFPF